MRFVLVHSPLVGPSTWRPVAEVLTELGHEVTLPDLRAAAQSGDPNTFVAAAQAVVSVRTDVIAGHSGAGFFLPSIASGGRDTAQLMFVDAGIPPHDGPATPGGTFIDQLRALSSGGLLPLWSTWWGDGVMEHLVPDRSLRAEIEAELVEVPIGFYERSVELPDGWSDVPAGYVLLSETYRDDAATARALGWPTRELLGTHLDLANRPGEIARSMLELYAASD
jgi:hypothetical protein